jgi:hypothetical protein
MRRAGQMTRLTENRHTKFPLKREVRNSLEDLDTDARVITKRISEKFVDRINMVHDRDQWHTVVNAAINLPFHKFSGIFISSVWDTLLL